MTSRSYEKGQSINRHVFKNPDVVTLLVRDDELADLDQYSIYVINPFGSNSAEILIEGMHTPGTVPPLSNTTPRRLQLVPAVLIYRWA